MRIVLFGATGMVGRGVLLEALDDPTVTAVLAVGRSAVPDTHPKLRQLVRGDLFDLAPVREELRGYDACIFCLGVSAVGMTEADYTRVTYVLTLAVARLFLEMNPQGAFHYVSGQSTDATERGRMMWARVKGRTENALLALPFRSVTMFRPGVIQPERGITSKVGWYRAIYALMKPLSGLLVRRDMGTTTTRLGRAMLEAVEYPPEKRVLENRDINRLAEARGTRGSLAR